MANGVDTQIDLVAQILDPNAFRVREQALVRSAQEGRHAEAQNRRAERDQQLQEILAPLQLQSQMQTLKLNTLNLKEKQRAADVSMAAKLEMGEFQNAWVDLIRNDAAKPATQATFYERIKGLTNLGSSPEGMQLMENVVLPTIENRTRYSQAIEQARESTERSKAIQAAIAERTANTQKSITDRSIRLENLKAQHRQTLAQLNQAAIAQRAQRFIGRGEWQNRHVDALVNSTGMSHEDATELLGEVWDRQILPFLNTQTPGAPATQAPTVDPNDPLGILTPRP